MNNEEEIIFVPEEENNPIKIRLINLWNDIVFSFTVSWYIIKGYILWFIMMGSVEIEVGYKEDGEEKNYLYLKKLW